MTSADSQALIEEARRKHQSPGFAPSGRHIPCSACHEAWPCTASRLTNALEAEMAARRELESDIREFAQGLQVAQEETDAAEAKLRDLTDKIEALAERWRNTPSRYVG